MWLSSSVDVKSRTVAYWQRLVPARLHQVFVWDVESDHLYAYKLETLLQLKKPFYLHNLINT